MYEDDAMSSATRCVKRFAPNDKRRMGAHDHGHITACKISDARPDEMVVSWSGDHVYSFDLVKSPDARDAETQKDESFQAHRLRNRTNRKRKRKQAASSTSLAESGNSHSRLRRVSNQQQETGATALRVRYENGDTEEVPLDPRAESLEPSLDSDGQDALLGEAQRLAESIAHGLTRLRQELFDFSATLNEEGAAATENSTELSPHTSRFTTVLGSAAALLPEMDDIIRDWTYPMDPSEDDVLVQNTFRRNRQAAWRLVQASGTLSRVLGGQLQTLSSAPDPRLDMFQRIKPAVHEGRHLSRESRFCYDFLKAILLWLEGGPDAVFKGFVRPPSVAIDSPRFPLGDSDNISTSLEKLQGYLSDLADDGTPVINLDTNRFEVDETRHIFPNQKAAVQAFTRAVAGIELQLRHGQSEPRMDSCSTGGGRRIMDKGAAARFWGVKVGRSLLMQAAEGVTFDTVLRAFGGVRIHVQANRFEPTLSEIDPDQEERVVEDIDIILTQRSSPADTRDDGTASTDGLPGTVQAAVEDEDDDDRDEDNDDDESSDEGESDSDDEPAHALFRRRVAFGRSRERATVNLSVPYSSHSRVYKGHCNTRTVKDVNYYGLDGKCIYTFLRLIRGPKAIHFFWHCVVL